MTPLVVVAAGLFPLLAALRHLDDNSLTSWAWALEGRDLVGLWVLHLAAVAAAALAARRAGPRTLSVGVATAAAFAAGLAPALAGQPEAVIDAARYFSQAKLLELGGAAGFLHEWGLAAGAWTDLPLTAALYGLVFRVFGEHRLAAQLLSAALFALTVCATGRLGRLLWDEQTGASAALLLLAAPCLVVNVPLLMADLPATCATVLALWALAEALERGGPARIGAAGAAAGAALLAKYSTWAPLAAAFAVALGVRAARRQYPALRRGLAAAALAAGFPAAYLLAYPEVAAGQLETLRGFQWAGLQRWSESYASTFLFQVHPALAALAAVGLWRAARRRDPRALFAAAVPLALFALQTRRSRYLLPAIPGIALLAARGLEALGDPRRRLFAALAAAGFSLVTVLAVFVPFLRWTNTANLAAAGRFLDEHGVAVAAVTTVGTPGLDINPEVAVPLLDYHTGARVLAGAAEARRPAPERLQANSFRFTWEVPLPAWYRASGGVPSGAAQVLISGDPDAPLPPGLAEVAGGRPPDAVFARDAVYRFRLFVSVWLPEALTTR